MGRCYNRKRNGKALNIFTTSNLPTQDCDGGGRWARKMVMGERDEDGRVSRCKG